MRTFFRTRTKVSRSQRGNPNGDCFPASAARTSPGMPADKHRAPPRPEGLSLAGSTMHAKASLCFLGELSAFFLGQLPQTETGARLPCGSAARRWRLCPAALHSCHMLQPWEKPVKAPPSPASVIERGCNKAEGQANKRIVYFSSQDLNNHD